MPWDDHQWDGNQRRPAAWHPPANTDKSKKEGGCPFVAVKLIGYATALLGIALGSAASVIERIIT